MCGGAQWVVTPTVTVERHANAMDRVEPIGSGYDEPERAFRVEPWPSVVDGSTCRMVR